VGCRYISTALSIALTPDTTSRSSIMPEIPTLPALGTETQRLLHGRGGFHPGLQHVAIDSFPPVILMTFYEAREENADLITSLVKRFENDPSVEAAVVQERHLRRAPKRVVYGKLPRELIASESGLDYHLTLDRNQNHGFFLDMKTGRDWMRANSSGKRVLNLFAYTCSLSVAAIAGGAESVINLDMASGALATGRKNHQLNFDPETCRRSSYLAHDLFKSWGKLKRLAPFDLILIDPPSNQAGSFVAEKDYQKIVRRLPGLTGSNSQILACLNAPHLGEAFLKDLFIDFESEQRLGVVAGFEDSDPEAALKCLIFRR
jgi:23S rRNA (cytosine1962-C5)-methyltransferase